MHGRFLLVLFVLVSRTAYASESSSVDTELVDFAEQRDWSAVEKLLSSDVDVTITQPDGMMALHWATYHQHLPTVERLITAGADINAETRYQVTPLTIASRAGNAEILAALLAADGNVNTKLPTGETLLMTAARAGYVDVVRVLIDAGCDIDTAERRGQTALMWAAANGHTQVVQMLLDAGADRDRTLKSGFNAYLFAARQGQLPTVEALIDAGVDVDQAMQAAKGNGRNPRKGMSALMLAVESGHFELALRLVELGISPNDQRSGYAPLHAVTWVRKTERGDNPTGDPPPRGSGKVTSLQFVRRLVEAGADVNLRLEKGTGGTAKLNHQGATPFLLAAKTADLPLLKLLLELGADPHLTNATNTTALMATMGIGVVAVGEEPGTVAEVLAVGQWLIDLKVDVNAKDDNGETAMHGAAYRNYPDAVDFLAARGADPAVWDVKNNYGWTPTMIAQGNRPGSLKISPETIAALELAKERFALDQTREE
ncbi:MAG: ankyrin repeat domain-containing protein [Planctomycetota bacterium]